jgi:hypothetical protein
MTKTLIFASHFKFGRHFEKSKNQFGSKLITEAYILNYANEINLVDSSASCGLIFHGFPIFNNG